MNTITYLRLINRIYVSDDNDLNHILKLATGFNIGIKVGNMSYNDSKSFIDAIYITKNSVLNIEDLWEFINELNQYLDCYNGAKPYTYLELGINYSIVNEKESINGSTQIIGYYDSINKKDAIIAADYLDLPVINYKRNEHQRIPYIEIADNMEVHESNCSATI